MVKMMIFQIYSQLNLCKTFRPKYEISHEHERNETQGVTYEILF